MSSRTSWTQLVAFQNSLGADLYCKGFSLALDDRALMRPISEIDMKDVKNPLVISDTIPHLPPESGVEPAPVTRLTPHFHNIMLENATHGRADGWRNRWLA